MRFKRPLIALTICAVAAIPLVARANWFRDEAPPPNAKPLSAIIQAVEARRYGTITEVAFDDGKWEIEVHQAGGKEKEIHVDAVTGQIAPE